ncbi:hypothetical protein [Actinomadura rudentiformis]|uniref:Uncharacterized protein n=1 Tax=Actinomadura rudentiformis TaxID=359158 RepID=A0A6H9YFL9_9ACTN|nr:hypothetical protein [Actinomadura rudentiformis]KAB2344348.1 hypothetical protein F8566_30870 [Actinomadura rudentiformis]
MTVFSGLVRRVAAEAERQLREGASLIARISQDTRERAAELGRLQAYSERIRLLEETVKGQDAELRGLRNELDSLVVQLNDRLLPRLDERMDDTERDLTVVATTLVRTGKDTAGNSARLEHVERRVADLRGQLARMEQRSGLWRELQGNMARLGDDVDAIRTRIGGRVSEPMTAAGHEPVADSMGERIL